jgi:hypothetical protein
MAQYEPLNYEQPDNKLTAIADKLRKDLLVKNDFAQRKNEYGVVNPDAISDGDLQGKGTGIFLDTIGGGTSVDIAERKNEIKINKFQSDKPYTFPSV